MTVSYRAAHSRIQRARGKATAYACIQCERPAHDWALLGEPKFIDAVTGAGYSDVVEDYSPLCRGCHLAHDRGWRICPHGDERTLHPTRGYCILCHRDRAAEQRALSH